MPAPILAVKDTLDWHIADDNHQQHIISSISGLFSLSNEEESYKGLIWDINDINVAMEGHHDIGAILLFKGNTCNNLIRHIPHACHSKRIPFVSITRRISVAGSNGRALELRALLIENSNTWFQSFLKSMPYYREHIQ